MRLKPKIAILTLSILTIVFFQNCSRSGIAIQDSIGSAKLGVCSGVSCDLTPLTSKPAVTTILLALGDEADDQLVINGASAQLIAETVIRYTSPVQNPKILIVKDFNDSGEDPEDTRYVEELLQRYNVTYLEESNTGLSDENLKDFDLVWFNNPGHEMGSLQTRDALLRFHGGIVLQGDDLARGSGFSMEPLTGLKYLDNGTNVKCSDGKSYAHDNNASNQYRVTIDPNKITGADDSSIAFLYGNDIDNTVVSRVDVEIIATAKGGRDTCIESRPAIVRYLK